MPKGGLIPGRHHPCTPDGLTEWAHPGCGLCSGPSPCPAGVPQPHSQPSHVQGSCQAAVARCRWDAVPGASWMQCQGCELGAGSSQAAQAPPAGSGAEKSWGCLTPHHSPARAAPLPGQRKLLHKQPPSCTPVRQTRPACGAHTQPSPSRTQAREPHSQATPTTTPLHRVQPAAPHPCAWPSSLQGTSQCLEVLPVWPAAGERTGPYQGTLRPPLQLMAPEGHREQAPLHVLHSPACQDLSPQRTELVPELDAKASLGGCTPGTASRGDV